MDLLEAIRGRRTVRNFLDTPVSKELVKKMVTLGTYAPNAGNTQPWRFIAIESRKIRMQMKRIVDRVTEKVTGITIPEEKRTFQNLFFAAPTVLVCVMTAYQSSTDTLLKEKFPGRLKVRSERVNPSLQSLSAAITQILLAAHSEGIGSCWMTGPLLAREELSAYLSIKDPEEIAAFVALGYPRKTPSMPPRKPLDHVLVFLDSED